MSKRVHNKSQKPRLNMKQRRRALRNWKRFYKHKPRSQVSTIKFFRIGGFGFNSPRAVARRKEDPDESLGTPI